MPSFAFWKSSKPDESQSPLLSDAAVKEELSVIIPNVSEAVELNPGNQDSGVFLYDDDAQEIPGDQTPLIGPAEDTGTQLDAVHEETPMQTEQSSKKTPESSLLDVEVPSSCPESPAIAPDGPAPTAYDTVCDSPVVDCEVATEIPQQPETLLHLSERPISVVE